VELKTTKLIIGMILGLFWGMNWINIAPSPESVVFFVITMPIIGLTIGVILASLIPVWNWILFGVIIGGCFGLLNGLIVWAEFRMIPDPNVEIQIFIVIFSTVTGLITGVIIGGIAGLIAYFGAKKGFVTTEATTGLLEIKVSDGASVPEGKTRFLLLLLSFFVHLAGIVIGVIYIKRPDPASKKFAQQIFIATGAGMLIVFLYTLI
jgi:hypothetical protein